MGFQFVVMFTDSFTDDVAYVRDVEAYMYSLICYTPGCILDCSENFGLGSLHDAYVELTGARPTVLETTREEKQNLFFVFGARNGFRERQRASCRFVR